MNNTNDMVYEEINFIGVLIDRSFYLNLTVNTSIIEFYLLILNVMSLINRFNGLVENSSCF